MKILIIGAAGMIGMRLARSIIKDDFNGEINDITLFDVIPPKIENHKNSYKIKTGDISDPNIISELIIKNLTLFTILQQLYLVTLKKTLKKGGI